MLKYITVAIVLCCQLAAAQAQYAKDYKKAADRFYAGGDYNSATQYYEKYLAAHDKAVNNSEPYQVHKRKTGADSTEKASPEATVLYKLADSYRQLQDYTHAESWFKNLIDKDAAAYPQARYWYAISLRANGNYQAAQQQLEQYLQTQPPADMKAKAQQELANCTFIQQQLQQPATTAKVERLNGNVNKGGASYAAAWMNTGTLVFTATQPDASHSNAPEYNNALYTADELSGGFGEAQKMPVAGLNNMQQGVACFTPDGKKMFFTGWQVKGNTKTSAIYVSEKNGSSWMPATLAIGDVNGEGGDYRQPQVTPDGKYLLFSSNRPGGQGGFDVWYAPIDKAGRIGKPVNMGTAINTKEDDAAPFYFAPEKALVFASKGRTGMGGFDLFVATGEFNGAWSEARNLGYPVNSVKNDIYFAAKGKHLLQDAIISSDRASLCCLELLAVHTNDTPQTDTVSVATKTPDPFKGKEVLVTHDINFAYNDSAITPESYAYLNDIAGYLKANPGMRLEIAAHTDGIGSDVFNQKLSQARANACVSYLVKAGIDASVLSAKGYGECCPLENETDADGKDIPAAREKNRRVEFKLVKAGH